NRTKPFDGTRWGVRDITPDYHMVQNRANRYQQDRESMKTWAFSGLGRNFVLHDTCATEGEGPIWDRTKEHLGYTDQAIVAMRRVMLKAIRAVQEGKDPAHVFRDRAQNATLDLFVRNDVVLPSSIDWRGYWHDEAAQRALASTHEERARALVG